MFHFPLIVNASYEDMHLRYKLMHYHQCVNRIDTFNLLKYELYQ